MRPPGHIFKKRETFIRELREAADHLENDPYPGGDWGDEVCHFMIVLSYWMNTMGRTKLALRPHIRVSTVKAVEDARRLANKLPVFSDVRFIIHEALTELERKYLIEAK